MQGSRQAGPDRVFDAHLHIIDPRFPLQENNGYLPPTFTVGDYERRVADLGILGGAVVSGSFQGFDQNYLTAALTALGPTFVGVTQIPIETTDHEILRLDSVGVRAVRFNVRRGGSASLSDLDRLARRVHDLAGWHSEIYIDSRELRPILPTLVKLPALGIDHLGLSADGFPDLLNLVESGAFVKATGFGRVELDIADAMNRILDVNPGALVFGTDLPSTRAPRPFADTDLTSLHDLIAPEHLANVLWRNAARLYRLEPSAEPPKAASDAECG
ncbi:MAG: amidohydrolase family protein [Mycobacterium sp.]|nr:amidohydrolase family protein [Mycobacterium sp.]